MIICDANPSHATQVAALHVASWRDAYPAILDPAYLAKPVEDEKHAVWTERLRATDRFLKVMIAIDRDRVIGFVCTRLGFDRRWGALIDNLHTDPAERSRGVGAALLRSAASWVLSEDRSTGLHVYVFEENLRARRFYERHGAVAAGSTPSAIPSARFAPVCRLRWCSATDVG